MKKAIELIRVSTANQAGDDRASIPAQHQINKRTAELNGLTIVKSIQMEDVSGSNVRRAPEMKELLRLIKGPEIDGVVVREFSRLMRPDNLEDFAILQEFIDSKTKLYLPDSVIDFTTSGGWLLGLLRGGMAGQEKREFLARSLGAREEMRRQGKLASAALTLPYGVGYERPRERGGKPRWFYKPEAEKVRRCFDLICQGVTKYADLEKAVGLTRWNIRGILSNPIYTGWRVYDKKRDPSREGQYFKDDGRQAGRRKIQRDEDDVIRVKVIEEPLISESMFQHAKAIIDAKAKSHYRNREGHTPAWTKFIYQGFLFCDLCESPYYTYSTSQASTRFDYYKCRNRMPQSKLPVERRCKSIGLRREKFEEQLDNIFARQLTKKAFLKDLVLRIERTAEATTSKSRVARLQAEIARLQERRKRVLDMFEAGDINRDEKTLRLERIDADLQAAQRELMEMVPIESLLNPDKLLEIFAPFVEWPVLDVDEKRRMLTSFAAEIHAHDYKVSGISILGVAILSDAPKEVISRQAGPEALCRPKPRRLRDRLNTAEHLLGDYVIHHKMVC